MKAAKFEYFYTPTKEEVIEKLNEIGEEARILAGGQSLVPSMNFRLSRPDFLIDINGCKDLDFFKIEHEKLKIGALTRHSKFENNFDKSTLSNLLKNICPHIAHYPIRVRGTFCGSLAHADPASEWCCAFLALNGKIQAESKRLGLREIHADDFFKTMFVTALEHDELLVSVELPMLNNNWKLGFEEFSRRSGDFALAIAVVCIKVENEKITSSRISIGSVSSKPFLCLKGSEYLLGKTPDDKIFKEASEISSQEIEVIEDINASPDYKRELVKVMSYRALKKAFVS